jgi:crossover junction endodeoxyribonuclease RuvC
MRIMGVDPGLTRCGIGIIDLSGSQRVALVHVEVVKTDKQLPLEQRLLLLSRAFEQDFDAFQPDLLAVERMFSQHNVRTVMGTAQSAAVAVLSAARRDLPVHWHTPSEVKAAVTGNGRADKAQVAFMVTRVLGLAAAPKPVDATDALALAICQAWRGGIQRRLAQAVASQAGAGRGASGTVGTAGAEKEAGIGLGAAK